MKKLWLIQRCELGNGRLMYDYMGSTEFEIGNQAKSLKRIFAAGMISGSVTVNFRGKEIPVYMVTSKHFPFADYQPCLQLLAEYKLQLQEWTSFDDAVKVKAGVKPFFSVPRTNAWFDFENDVLWTLTKKNQKALVAVLEGIKKKWAEKE